jgi:hypothetical protein
VLSGLNLVPVDQISYVDSQGNLIIRAGIHGTDKSTMFINQSGELVAQNYSPIAFEPGILTIIQPPPQTTVTVEVVTVTVSPSSQGGGFAVGGLEDVVPPFVIPQEGQGFVRLAAKMFIIEAELEVTDIEAWLKDPVNRGLMLGKLIELLKAPIKEGTELYKQREIVKTSLERQIREMKVQIAKDAVQLYNDWKEGKKEDQVRLLGLLGNLDVPEEDFVTTATAQYITSAIASGALAGLIASMASMVAAGTVTAFHTGALGLFAGSLGVVMKAGGVSGAAVATTVSTSVAATAGGIIAGVLFAIAGTVARTLQYVDYKEVEDTYANLVNDAQNLDIDSLLFGDDAAQEELSGLLLALALKKPTMQDYYALMGK